jgi:hypothetical protein
MRVTCRSLVLSVAVGIGVLTAGGIARADATAWKAARDTDPHLALSAAQLDSTAEKRAAECGTGCGGNGDYPPSASLPANQTAQVTGYYCGPAAVHEALDALGVTLSQSAAASALHTTQGGTAWPGSGTSPSGYPVPDVLNRYENRVAYVPQPVSAATSKAIATYENDLEMDIAALRAPLLGDAWEVPGGPHLVGHPANQQIFHWFEIRGYQSSGATTMYEDSVHGAGSIGWSGSVPAYSTLPSSQIVTIVAGRGYIW